jgi:HEAT repeat protein
MSPDPELNRDLIEVLLIHIVDRRLNLEHNREFELLLSARDSNVRRFAARTLGWFRIKSAAPALTAVLEEENEDLRSDFIWALGQMDPAEAIDPLITVLQSDSASICRRTALEALSNLNQRMKAMDLAQDPRGKKLFIDTLTTRPGH